MATDKIDIKPTTSIKLFKNPEFQKAYEKSKQVELIDYKYTEAQMKIIRSSQELAARLFNRARNGEVLTRDNV